MTNEEARRIAVDYLLSRTDLCDSCEREPVYVGFVKAKPRRGPHATSDTWIVHFSFLVSEGVCQDPSALIILVDNLTGEASVSDLP